MGPPWMGGIILYIALIIYAAAADIGLNMAWQPCGTEGGGMGVGLTCVVSTVPAGGSSPMGLCASRALVGGPVMGGAPLWTGG